VTGKKTFPEPEAEPHFVLRLFVTGMTPRSTRAIRAVRDICDGQLAGRHTLEIIDVYQRPELIQNEQIFATPTLIKYEPAPLRRIIGDMSDLQRLTTGLGLNHED
jgi:circadian clock protein KaiB